jgi:hypothetical protein
MYGMTPHGRWKQGKVGARFIAPALKALPFKGEGSVGMIGKPSPSRGGLGGDGVERTLFRKTTDEKKPGG